jgi:hypothetical protein
MGKEEKSTGISIYTLESVQFFLLWVQKTSIERWRICCEEIAGSCTMTHADIHCWVLQLSTSTLRTLTPL